MDERSKCDATSSIKEPEVDSQRAPLEEVLEDLPDGGEAAARLARRLFREIKRKEVSEEPSTD